MGNDREKKSEPRARVELSCHTNIGSAGAVNKVEDLIRCAGLLVGAFGFQGELYQSLQAGGFKMEELQEFLEEEKEKRKNKPTPDNFDRLVREWQLQIKELHDQLETWLEPEKKEELIDILRGYPVSVQEEGLPKWEVDIFIIFFEELEIVLKPESRFRAENEGVLKIETDKTHGKIIRCPKQDETGFNNWIIKREEEKKPLTEKTFKQTLKKIIKKAGKFT